MSHPQHLRRSPAGVMMEGVTENAAGHFLQNILSPSAEPGPPHVHTFSPAGPDPEEAMKWLREQIQADLSAAKIISDGGFEFERWATDPPGQVNPGDHKASAAITSAAGLDPDLCYPHWTMIIAWNRLNDEPPEADRREEPVALVSNGRRQFEHIIRHDPRNVAADCEARLALLDICERVIREDEPGDGDNWTGLAVARLTTRFLAAGFRHREGYSRYWGDSVTHTITETGQ